MTRCQRHACIRDAIIWFEASLGLRVRVEPFAATSQTHAQNLVDLRRARPKESEKDLPNRESRGQNVRLLAASGSTRFERRMRRILAFRARK